MSRVLLFCVAAVLIELTLTLLLLSPDSIRQAIQAEWKQLGRVLGPQARDSILSNANRLFRLLYTDSGLLGGSYRLAQRHRRAGGRHGPTAGVTVSGGQHATTTGLFKDRLESFWANQYQLSIRLSQLLYWLPGLLVILIPSLVDGLVRRKIRSFSFQYYSAERFSFGLRLLAVLSVVMALLLFSPLYVSPHWIPATGTLLAFSVMFVVANAKSAL